MGKIRSNDCCCSDWKSIIKELWAKYQNVVKSIIMGGRAYYPDGDGNVTLPMPDIAGGIMLTDMTDFWIMTVTDDEDIQLTNNVTYWTLEVVYE